MKLSKIFAGILAAGLALACFSACGSVGTKYSYVDLGEENAAQIKNAIFQSNKSHAASQEEFTEFYGDSADDVITITGYYGTYDGNIVFAYSSPFNCLETEREHADYYIGGVKMYYDDGVNPGLSVYLGSSAPEESELVLSLEEAYNGGMIKKSDLKEIAAAFEATGYSSTFDRI